MAWLDLLIIVLIVLSVIIGYKKGFVLTLFSMGSYIVALILSKTYYGNLTKWIKEHLSLSDRIGKLIEGYIELNVPNSMEGISLEGKSPEIILENSSKIPGFLQNYILNEIDVQTFAQQTIESFKNQVIDSLVTLVLNIISIIILFLIIRWTIVIIGILINKVFELPLLGGLNHTLGGILGGVRGIFIVFIAILILIPFTVLSPQGAIALSVEDSYIVQFFLNNVVSYLLKAIGIIIKS